MKRSLVFTLALLSPFFGGAQILDSLQQGAQSVTYEIIAASEYEDFGANVYGNQLLYVSSRGTSLFSDKYDYNNQKFFDLYLYDLKTKKVSRYGDQLESISESKYHMGPSILLPDSAGVILSRNYRIPNVQDEVNFFLVYENFKTGERYTLPYCTREYSFQHPFFDAKTRRLYFSANLAGGPGGYDIYFSDFLKDGTWGDPVLVEGVNGPRDDVFPTIQGGKLYFSRTVTQMGLDVFVHDFKTGLTAACEAPFITSRDEFSLIALNKDSAVFSQSQRGRYNTDLVLAYVETDGLEPKPVTEDFAVIVEVPEDQTPEEYLAAVKTKWTEDEVWVGEQDGRPVVVIRGKRPESEAAEVKDQIVALGIPAELTKDPVDSIAAAPAPLVVMNTVYPVDCSYEDCFDQLDAIKARTGADSLWLGELNGRPVVVITTKKPFKQAEGAKDWAEGQKLAGAYLTPNMPKPLARPEKQENNYSTIVGVFERPELAQKHLANIQKWEGDAFISLYKGKYYVVSADYTGEKAAVVNRGVAVENGIADAWLLPEKLYPMVLPDLSGSPDLIVYFRFDKYDVMEKYQQQIDDVIAQLPNGVERVFMVGHTDSRGTNAYNDRLSRNRVEAVAAYMTSEHPKFTAVKELDSKGENELTNNCGDGVECDPYAHFLNRRVEVWFY
ncbi:MAG: OmpA family protein [Flavobacteriales bacterium]|jgi:outer membrane protein OmpA-like peptidoglycan-associated protein